MLPEAAAAIREARTLVLACHVNPDGDALGSMLGMALGLAPLDQSLTCLSADGVPEALQFLPGAERIQKTSDQAEFDLALALDSSDLSRVGEAIKPAVERARRIVNIDHHATGAPFGDIQVVDTRAASTAEIVFALLNALGLPITPEVATCLFTGIITDTGSFRFQNVTADTMTVAARLIDAGASPAFVSEHVFENRTFAATKLLGLALSSLSRTQDGRIAWAHVTREDFARLGATDEDSEGLVNPVRSVRGAEVGVSFREMPDGTVRVSLRSREGVDVGQIAQQFGGGGHRMAAGCTLTLPLAEAETVVLDALRAALPERVAPQPPILGE